MKKDKDIKVNISLKYADDDISKYIRNITFTNSVIFNYVNVLIILSMEFGEFAIKHNLRGKKLLQLKISTKDPDGNDLDLNIFDLVILESNIALFTQDIDFKEDPNMQPRHSFQDIILHTAPIHAIETFSTIINYTGVGINKGPVGILKSILEKRNIKHQIDLRASNKNKIEQLCIPPMSLNKVVRFLNEYYGFYNGPLFFQCDNSGKFKMWCLEPKFKDKSVVFIYQYFRAKTAKSEFLKEMHEHEATFKPDITYITTKEPIHVLRVANLNLMKHKFKHIHIKHPRDDLYSVGGIDVNRIINDTEIKGKIYKRNMHNRKLNSLIDYNILNSGESVFNDTLEKARYNINYIDSAPIKVTLKGYYRIKHLLLVGQPVRLKSFVNKYKQFSGKYMFHNSKIQITAKDDSNKWFIATEMELVRYA